MIEIKCPACGKMNTDNWPLFVYGEIREGGCQVCWESNKYVAPKPTDVEHKLRAEVQKLKNGICEHVEQNILVPDCKLCEMSADANTAREYIPKIKKKVEELEAKIEELKKYAAHKPNCLFNGARGEVYGPESCTCGLYNLIGEQ